MKRLPVILIFFLCAGSLTAQDIPPRPNPPRLVNDLAEILSESEIDALERKLRAYHDSTSTQIAVVTLHSIGPYEVVDYAFRVGEKWGVGQKGKSNGIVVLVAVDDHKAAIVTGYGMEGSITDADTRRVRENYMNPNFRNENFYKGLDEATTALIKLASGEYINENPSAAKKVPSGLFFILFIIIVVILRTVLRVQSYRRSHFGSRDMSLWTIFWLMSHRGGHGGGGFGGGSSGFGGGGGGGGFGGFGGGSFGGGGSGGSW